MIYFSIDYKCELPSPTRKMFFLNLFPDEIIILLFSFLPFLDIKNFDVAYFRPGVFNQKYQLHNLLRHLLNDSNPKNEIVMMLKDIRDFSTLGDIQLSINNEKSVFIYQRYEKVIIIRSIDIGYFFKLSEDYVSEMGLLNTCLCGGDYSIVSSVIEYLALSGNEPNDHYLSFLIKIRPDLLPIVKTRYQVRLSTFFKNYFLEMINHISDNVSFCITPFLTPKDRREIILALVEIQKDVYDRPEIKTILGDEFHQQILTVDQILNETKK